MDDHEPTVVPAHPQLRAGYGRLVLPPEARLEVIGPKTWQVLGRVRKWDHDGDRERGVPPVEEVVRLDNMIVDVGVTEMLSLLGGIANGAQPYSAALARLLVGNGTTAESAGQTGLVGTQAALAMDAGFPSLAGRTIAWQGTAGTGVANFAWEEWGLDNGSVRAKLLNRRKASFGTKSGQAWELNVAVTVAA